MITVNIRMLCVAMCSAWLWPGCIWVTPGLPKPIPGYDSVYIFKGVSPSNAMEGHSVLVMAANEEYFTLCNAKMHEISHVLRLPERKGKGLYSRSAMLPILVDGIFLYRGRVINADMTVLSPLVPGYVPLAPDGQPRMGAWWVTGVAEKAYVAMTESTENSIRMATASPQEEAAYLRDLLTVDCEMIRGLDSASQEAVAQAQAYARTRLQELQIPWQRVMGCRAGSR